MTHLYSCIFFSPIFVSTSWKPQNNDTERAERDGLRQRYRERESREGWIETEIQGEREQRGMD
jgi:hypothetical protein